MWLVLGALVGVAAGAGLYLLAERPEPFAEGTCVALEADEALHVSCDDPAADGRITTITDEPQGCEGADGGWIERPDGRIACVELLPEE